MAKTQHDLKKKKTKNSMVFYMLLAIDERVICTFSNLQMRMKTHSAQQKIKKLIIVALM